MTSQPPSALCTVTSLPWWVDHLDLETRITSSNCFLSGVRHQEKSLMRFEMFIRSDWSQAASSREPWGSGCVCGHFWTPELLSRASTWRWIAEPAQVSGDKGTRNTKPFLRGLTLFRTVRSFTNKQMKASLQQHERMNE